MIKGCVGTDRSYLGHFSVTSQMGFLRDVM